MDDSGGNPAALGQNVHIPTCGDPMVAGGRARVMFTKLGDQLLKLLSKIGIILGGVNDCPLTSLSSPGFLSAHQGLFLQPGQCSIADQLGADQLMHPVHSRIQGMVHLGIDSPGHPTPLS